MFETFIEFVNTLPPGTPEIVGTWIAALLTLAILSYILGDNPVFRLAEYLFVGIAAGYAAAMTWNSVLWPRLRLLLGDPVGYWYYGLFFILGLMLLSRGCRAISLLGNLPLGVLFGTGAGLALGGALSGSLVPQLKASIVSVAPADYGAGLKGWAYALDALLLILGTIAVFSAFHFTKQSRGPLGAFGHKVLQASGSVGRKIIMVAFGALLAGAALSFFAILLSRLDFLIGLVSRLASAGL